MVRIEEGVYIVDGVPVVVAETAKGTTIYSLNGVSSKLVCTQTYFPYAPRGIPPELFRKAKRIGGLEKITTIK